MEIYGTRIHRLPAYQMGSGVLGVTYSVGDGVEIAISDNLDDDESYEVGMVHEFRHKRKWPERDFDTTEYFTRVLARCDLISKGRTPIYH